MVKWIVDFNSNRSIAFSFDGKTEQPTPFNTGLPQGSPISAIAFAIYSVAVDPLSPVPAQEWGMTYVDNNTMLQPTKSVIFTTHHLQEHFCAKQVRADLLNISYAPAKTEKVHLFP